PEQVGPGLTDIRSRYHLPREGLLKRNVPLIGPRKLEVRRHRLNEPVRRVDRIRWNVESRIGDRKREVRSELIRSIREKRADNGCRPCPEVVVQTPARTQYRGALLIQPQREADPWREIT